MLRAENIGLRKETKTILAEVTLAVPPGEILAIVGPNGSGKSSLMQVLACLQPPTAGKVYLGGEDIYSSADPVRIRRKTAVVFQDALLCTGTVAANAAMGLTLRRIPAAEAAAQAGRWLEQFGVGHLAARSARYLSGGEAQRVSLARAFAVEPEVLFLDEPFAALDTPTRSRLLTELRAILRQQKQTTVFISHDYTEVSVLADQVTALLGGRIVQTAAPAELFARPRTAELAAFLGIENILPARSTGGEIITERGLRFRSAAPVPDGVNGAVCFRGEDVRFAAAGGRGPAEPAANACAGTIREIMPRGSKYLLLVDCGETITVLASQSEYWRRECAEGQQVELYLRPEFVHFIPKEEEIHPANPVAAEIAGGRIR